VLAEIVPMVLLLFVLDQPGSQAELPPTFPSAPAEMQAEKRSGLLLTLTVLRPVARGLSKCFRRARGTTLPERMMR